MQQKQHPLSMVCVCAPSDRSHLEQWESHLHPLEQAGLLTIWSELHLVAGAQIGQQISEHLEQADLLVLLLSADFFAADDCMSLIGQAFYQQKNGSLRILPLLVRPVIWQDSPLGTLPCLPANGIPIMIWEHPDEGWLNAVQDLRRWLSRASVPHTALHIWTIPFPRNPVFTGHEEILVRLSDAFKIGQSADLSQAQAISGLGGIGKTQIAIEYAYRYRKNYRAVLWARAETREELISSYSALARVVQFPEQKESD